MITYDSSPFCQILGLLLGHHREMMACRIQSICIWWKYIFATQRPIIIVVVFEKLMMGSNK